MLTEDWLTGWAARLDAAVTRALRDVVSTFPFEAGAHQVGPPASPAELTALREALPSVPDPLVALQRHVGPVALPDIGNGYFLHPAEQIAAGGHDGRADRIGSPFDPGVDIVVFGSNGGGDRYAVATGDGRVFRLRDTSYVDGVHEGTDHGITVVGPDLPHFLELLLAATAAFADDGSVTDL